MVASTFLGRPTASEPSCREALIRSKLSPLRIPNGSNRVPIQQQFPSTNDLSRKDPPSPPGCPPSSPTRSAQHSFSVDDIEELYAQLPYSYSSESEFMAYSSAVVGLAVAYPQPQQPNPTQTASSSTTVMAQSLGMHTSAPSIGVTDNRIMMTSLHKQ